MASENGKPAKPLTAREEEFCREIVRGAKLYEAFRASHNTEKMKGKTVYEKASRLMATGKIQTRIEEIRAPALRKVQYDYARWLEEVQRCAFFDVRNLFDNEGNPIGMHTLNEETAPAVAGFEIAEGSTKKIRLTDKLKALELFGKATGYYVDHSVPAPSQLESASTELLLTMCAAIRERMKLKQITQHADSP